MKIPEGGSLLDSLAGVCRDRPLEEKVLIAPSLLIGHELAERVARAGTPWINLRVETVRTLAHALVARDLAREGRRLLSRAQALALVEQACAQALGEDSYFGFLSDRPGLHRAVQSALDELRAAGVGPDRLPAGAFGDRRKHRALQETFRRHEEALEAGRYVDRAEVLRRAEAVLAPTPSSEGPIYLLPGSTVLSPLERRFLERLAGQRLIALSEGPPDVWKQIARRARLLRASGEENELRAAFRRILKDGIPFDEVEILHTDKAVYPALAWELSREHQIPCTFSEGVLASYTRPGRAAIAFLEWIGQDFAAERLRLALASGAIGLSGAGVEGAAAAREAARGLREAEIGWGRDRHRKCLDRLVEELEQPEPSRRGDDEASPELRARRARARQRRLAAARLARDFARRALDLAPFSPDGPGDLASLARGVRTFVQEFARVADPLDATAREALETLLSELEELDAPRSSLADSVERLCDAVTRLSVAADRPRPGRVHVAFYGAGGFSGRRQTFLVGLDAARHPGPDVEDPILLDEERRRINQELPEAALGLHRERPHEAAAALWSCVGRLTGALDASYSSFGLRNLSQAGEPAPSAAFLELHRARCGRPEADYEDLLESMTEAVGFVPLPDDALDETEWWLAQARRLPPGSAAPQVEQR
ncbi:MAG TPA: hypothetical protein VEG84_08655, partial [Thermoanaerobaculia bacterium]|nr:hypothetical protein [Thermoanaerobaculia bacterium]